MSVSGSRGINYRVWKENGGRKANSMAGSNKRRRYRRGEYIHALMEREWGSLGTEIALVIAK